MLKPVYHDSGTGIPLAWNDPDNDDPDGVLEWWYNPASGARLRVTKQATVEDVYEELGGPPDVVVTGPRGGVRRALFGDRTFLNARLLKEMIANGAPTKVED